jgi:adenylate cyclase
VDSRFSGAHSVILQGIRSTMSVPLMLEERLLGVIHLDNLMSSGAFTEKDLQLLTGFANQAAMAIENSRLTERIREEAVVRAQLGRLLSPNLVEQVVSGQLEVKKGGELRRATVLFSDIRGFTSMSENTPAPEIVAMLNDYFEIMVDIVFKYEGTLDKFVGDELMCVWGAPVARPDDPIRTVRAAVEMMIALAEFNRTREAEGSAPLRIGIGINTGDMVSGYMGSARTMSYTVIGDSVNLGARLCSAAKAGEILISDGTYTCVANQVIAEVRDPISVKGKAKPIPIYNVTGAR